jgi:two-component system nitrogen regulation response regulator GlnG
LYHRLSIFTIQVPPLRNLSSDRFLLLDHFRAFYAAQAKTAQFQLDEEAEKLWNNYPFPGNTRELRNIVIRLSTKYPGQKIDVSRLESELDLPPADAGRSEQDLLNDARTAMQQGIFNLDEHLMEYTSRHVDMAMDMARGNISEAAKLLGIARTTLYSRIEAMQKYRALKKP